MLNGAVTPDEKALLLLLMREVLNEAEKNPFTGKLSEVQEGLYLEQIGQPMAALALYYQASEHPIARMRVLILSQNLFPTNQTNTSRPSLPPISSLINIADANPSNKRYKVRNTLESECQNTNGIDCVLTELGVSAIPQGALTQNMEEACENATPANALYDETDAPSDATTTLKQLQEDLLKPTPNLLFTPPQQSETIAPISITKLDKNVRIPKKPRGAK